MGNPDLLRLAGIVFVAVSLVVIGDTAGKLMTAGGVAPGFVAWSRFVIGAALMLPLSGLSRADLPHFRDWRIWARGIIIAVGILSILTALKTEPLANVIGAFFIGPIISYGLAVVFMGERPTPQRAALLVLGFVGVMLIVRPGFGVSFGLLFALLAGLCYGSYLALTRSVAGRYRPRFLLISQLLVGAAVLAPVGLGPALPSFDLRIALLVLVSALGSALGNYLLVLASRKAEASLIAPLVYSQLITATALGVIVFGDWPDRMTLLGLAVIFVSGVGTLWTVRRRKSG